MSGQTIVVRGIIGAGVECRSLKSDEGSAYSLVGDTSAHADGERVIVTGTIAEMSFCMSGITISVSRIEAASAMAAVAPAGDGFRLVMSVDDLIVRTDWSLPPGYRLWAEGTVRTGGWSEARLRPLFTPGETPRDDLYRFAFEAKPPAGAATQALETVYASWGRELLGRRDRAAKGIIIQAETNEHRWPPMLPQEEEKEFGPLALGASPFERLLPRRFPGGPFPGGSAGPAPILPIGKRRTATARSLVSFEDAAAQAAAQLRTPGTADEAYAVSIVSSRVVLGGFIGTTEYEVTASRSSPF